MKIARYLADDGPTWGLVEIATERATVRPIRGAISEWAPALVSSGFTDLPVEDAELPLESVRLLAPVEAATKVLGVGANYWEHLRRLGRTERPTHLASFIKPISAIVGPDDEIRYPLLTQELDYEVELVAVMGTPVTPMTADAVPAVLGYTVGNDISARDFRHGDKGPDLVSMKANDATTPLGPWIVTADELAPADQLDLTITCRVDGEVRQEDSTSQMLWRVPEILDFFRLRISLAPGDMVFTGTTCGVGLEDGRFLTEGQTVETEVESIGVLRNVVGARGERG